MNRPPGEHVSPDDELVPPGHDIVREANWMELSAKKEDGTQGLFLVRDQVDLTTAGDQRALRGWQDEYGVENIYIGSAYSLSEGRPLDHMPGSGIYVTRAEFNRHYPVDQPPSTGPASS